MIVREVVNGVVRKPFVVNYSELVGTACIVARVKQFRTKAQMDDFLYRLPKMPGFIRINSVYNMDGAMGYIR